MNCIIEGIDFYDLPAMKYYSPSTSWSAEKKKENAMQKIFSGDWWGARKVDGIFVMVGKNLDNEIFLRPRAKNTKGEFVNKVEWVPQIHRYLNSLEPGTVLLGELYLPRDEQAKSTSSIMNSLQPRAVKKQQKEEDKLHLYIFDILANKGKSLLNEPALRRFKTLYHMSSLHADYVEWAKYCNGQELWDMLQQLLADGYEGVVITHQDAPYQPGKRSNKVSLKIKKELQDTVDCIMIGANAPAREYTGKEIETWPYWINDRTNEKIVDNEISNVTECTKTYEDYSNGETLTPVTKNWFYGWAGSWKLGAYKDGKIVQIGSLSGLTDEMKENWKDYVGKVCEVSAMETSENQEGGRGLRHPKLIRIVESGEKDPKDCTYERIFEK